MCSGPRQRKVTKSQAGEDGLCAVGQRPGAAEPRKPGAQVTEELRVTTRWRKVNSMHQHAKQSFTNQSDFVQSCTNKELKM